MYRYCVFLFAMCLCLKAFSTGQEPDILIYAGKEYALLATPLEAYPCVDSISAHLFGDKEADWHTGCWRAYIAEWTIEDDQIFLTNIFSCNYSEDSLKANLETLFPSKCVNGKVKGDWVSDELLVADGDLVFDFNDGFYRFYEKEKGFFIENGNLKRVVDYDNSKMKKSEYAFDDALTQQFIYSTIRWDALPDVTDQPTKIIVRFSTGEMGNPENISLVRSCNDPIFDEEAKRVIGLLKWNVYYKKGEVVRMWWTIPVIFSQEYKDKYDL